MRMIPYPGDEFPALSGLREQMNRLFDGAFGRSAADWPTDAWLPPIDVVETPETLVVKAELPGIDAKEIEISVQGDQLTLRGEKREEKEEKGKTWYRKECSSGQFRRTLTLPARVDADRIEAQSRGGVLTITLPKSEESKPRRITVKAH